MQPPNRPNPTPSKHLQNQVKVPVQTSEHNKSKSNNHKKTLKTPKKQ